MAISKRRALKAAALALVGGLLRSAPAAEATYSNGTSYDTVDRGLTVAGSLGVNTASPRAALDLGGGMSQTNAGANQYYRVDGLEYWRTYPAYPDGHYYITRGAQNPGGGVLDLLVLRSNGDLQVPQGSLSATYNVGIGTTAP